MHIFPAYACSVAFVIAYVNSVHIWPTENIWQRGRITRYDAKTKLHIFHSQCNGNMKREWIDMVSFMTPQRFAAICSREFCLGIRWRIL